MVFEKLCFLTRQKSCNGAYKVKVDSYSHAAPRPRPDRPGVPQPLDVEALARGAHLSAGHLSRQFRLAYGESPYSAVVLCDSWAGTTHNGLVDPDALVGQHRRKPLRGARRLRTLQSLKYSTWLAAWALMAPS
jgi:AraC-like DNA-binding protein